MSQSKLKSASLNDLESLMESFIEPLSTIVTKNELTLVLFADKSMLDNSDIRFIK